jgi:hypothetical protein
MANQSGFSENYARAFVQLAEIAQQDLSRPRIVLPQGWSLLQKVVSDKSVLPPVPNAQGFYAQGKPDGVSTSVMVLALGIPWLQFLNNFSGDLGLQTDMPPARVVGSGTPPMFIVQGFGSMYNQIRASIWSNLNLAAEMPLYIVGKGLGGPMAQLAAIDLRSGNTGPAGQNAPSTTPTCYVFSSVPFGDINFATFYGQKVPQSYTVQAGNSGLMVDFFPTVPDGFAIAGQQKNYQATVPSPYDDPWVERSGDFYLTLMNGTPQPPPLSPVDIPSPPTGFTRALAYTLAQLCAVAYQRRQHPDMTISANIAPYQLQGDITAQGTNVCSLFSSPDSVVAAFSAPTTWEELATISANSLPITTGFIDNSAYISQGLLNAYTAGITSDSKAASFRTTLFAQLKTLLSGTPVKKLYLTGHDFGGAMANLAALDLRSNQPSLTLTKVYTFGSLPTGDVGFADLFGQKVGSDSYQLARPGDFAPKMQPTNFDPLDQQVSIKGTPSNDVNTNHPITGYINLLNPSGGMMMADDFLAEKMSAFGLSADDVHTGEIQPNEQGEIVLSNNADESAIKPVALEDAEKGHAFAAENIVVSPNRPLIITGSSPVNLVFASMTIEPGGRVFVECPANLQIGTLQVESPAGENAQDTGFWFVGINGAQGGSGSQGQAGAPGAGSSPGAAGGPGGSGSMGAAGGNAPPGTIYIDRVSGIVQITVRGGTGGAGGAGGSGGTGGKGGPQGGAGGSGGQGGNGGTGGNGGNGSTVVVSYGTLEPGAEFVTNTSPAPGGAGGMGGPGGIGGDGTPPGQNGPVGSPGQPGQSGMPGTVVIKHTPPGE